MCFHVFAHFVSLARNKLLQRNAFILSPLLCTEEADEYHKEMKMAISNWWTDRETGFWILIKLLKALMSSKKWTNCSKVTLILCYSKCKLVSQKLFLITEDQVNLLRCNFPSLSPLTSMVMRQHAKFHILVIMVVFLSSLILTDSHMWEKLNMLNSTLMLTGVIW